MPNHHHDHGNTKNIRAAFLINLCFTIIEIAGGLYTNSLAILSDALHDFGDSLSLGMSWYFENLSAKKRTKIFSYGYRRFSLLAALINSVILIIGSVIILTQAIPAIFNPGNPDEQGMLIIAILGVIFNGLAFFKLESGHSLNEKVVRLHLLEDLLGWIAVLIASIIMNFYDMPVLDPILSLAIAIFIAFNAIRNLVSSLKIMLQAVPEEVEIKKLEQMMRQINGVKSVHDTHIWTLDGKYNILSIHLVVAKNVSLLDTVKIKQQARNLAKEQKVQHATFEIGMEGEKCEFEDC
jgi:cobalt-zinc-cadmium efflux system protein